MRLEAKFALLFIRKKKMVQHDFDSRVIIERVR